MVIICYVCRNNVPVAFKQDHHKRPQAAGGGPMDEVQLCSGCHHNLHRIADMLMHGKSGLAEDSAKIAYPDLQVRARAFELAQLVVEWMTAKKDGKLSPLSEAPVMILLPLPVKQAAQLMAREMRGSTGRPLGLATFIRMMVCEAVYRKFPQLRPKQG